MFVLPHDILSTKPRGFLLASHVNNPFFLSLKKLPKSGQLAVLQRWCVLYMYICAFLLVWYFGRFSKYNLWKGIYLFFFFLYFSPPSALLPVLHHKAKKGPPRQAKYAIHCIHAIFSSKETQFAQIFEVKLKYFIFIYLLISHL